MTILLVEDERRAANVLLELLAHTRIEHQILGVFDSVEHTVAYLQTNAPQPDLIFLDIQLADGNGFEIFNRVQVQSAVIICSSTADYSVQARTVNIIGNLLKPVNTSALIRILAQTDCCSIESQKEWPGGTA